MAKLNFAHENALAFTTASESIKHVEEYEAGECHGCVTRSDGVIVGHFFDVDEEGAEHDRGGLG